MSVEVYFGEVEMIRVCHSLIAGFHRIAAREFHSQCGRVTPGEDGGQVSGRDFFGLAVQLVVVGFWGFWRLLALVCSSSGQYFVFIVSECVPFYVFVFMAAR